jgi:DNA polymerase-1
MLLTVHDELVFEVREACADDVAAMVKTHMEAAAQLDVPVTVDVGIGASWRDAK